MHARPYSGTQVAFEQEEQKWKQEHSLPWDNADIDHHEPNSKRVHHDKRYCESQKDRSRPSTASVAHQGIHGVAVACT
jgi:hypothetical protein